MGNMTMGNGQDLVDKTGAQSGGAQRCHSEYRGRGIPQGQLGAPK